MSSQDLLRSGLGCKAEPESQLLLLRSFLSSEPLLVDAAGTQRGGGQGGACWKVPFSARSRILYNVGMTRV